MLYTCSNERLLCITYSNALGEIKANRYAAAGCRTLAQQCVLVRGATSADLLADPVQNPAERPQEKGPVEHTLSEWRIVRPRFVKNHIDGARSHLSSSKQLSQETAPAA